MPDREIDIILGQLREMREEMRHDNERLHDRLDALTRNGCARADEHKSAMTDHEERLRTVERFQERQAGMAATVGVAGGVGVSLLVTVGKFLLTKVWGAGT